jgi:hypothetical protein
MGVSGVLVAAAAVTVVTLAQHAAACVFNRARPLAPTTALFRFTLLLNPLETLFRLATGALPTPGVESRRNTEARLVLEGAAGRASPLAAGGVATLCRSSRADESGGVGGGGCEQRRCGCCRTCISWARCAAAPPPPPRCSRCSQTLLPRALVRRRRAVRWFTPPDFSPTWWKKSNSSKKLS